MAERAVTGILFVYLYGRFEPAPLPPGMHLRHVDAGIPVNNARWFQAVADARFS